jgi:hypothetical protein
MVLTLTLLPTSIFFEAIFVLRSLSTRRRSITEHTLMQKLEVRKNRLERVLTKWAAAHQSRIRKKVVERRKGGHQSGEHRQVRRLRNQFS